MLYCCFLLTLVDVNLDPTLAHRHLVSTDGKRVNNKEDNREAWEQPWGSTSGKSYREVVVINRTGWDLGVARCDTSHKRQLGLEYAARTAPPVCLSLKGNAQKAGVFVECSFIH